MSRSMPVVAGLMVAGLSSPAMGATPPQILPHDNYQNLLRLPDDTLWRVAGRANAVYYSRSTDHGLTWEGAFTPEWKLMDVPGTSNPIPVVADDGSIHFFKILRDPDTSNLHLYELESDPTRTTWTNAGLIHGGRIGSVNQAIQTSSGRLLAGFNDRSVKPPAGHGNFITRIAYQDAGSATWHISESELISPVPSDWNGSPDGAVEPSMIELNDGRLWMLLRSQTGKLRESFSTDDGTTWSPTVDSNFYTTTGPTNLTRLDDGRIVLIWNNGTMPARHENKVWYAGRDALHAAISDDDGQTWKGFREIYLDPNRNLNPAAGDTGTAYPFATATGDGHVLLITGQATARTMMRIDPDWLLETDRGDDFTGANALDQWSVFKSFGPVGEPQPVKRSREQGAVLIDDPSPDRTKPVLHVRRPDEHDGDGAAWNFPMTARGRTSVRLQLQEGFGGGTIALTDRFLSPTDAQGETTAFYRLDIPASGLLPTGQTLEPGRWYDVTLDWNVGARKAILRLDGEAVGTFDATPGVEAWPGMSYLRLRSAAADIDPHGYLVDSVFHDGSDIGDAQRMTDPQATAALTGTSDWTTVRFDDYVPNTSGGGGVTAAFTGTFTGFVNPTTGAAPVGIVVESSSGAVTFTDATSAQVTSDLLGPKQGETMTIRFVDPADPDRPATVSEVAWRFGSVLDGNVKVQLFDADGNELPDWLFAAMRDGVSGVTGYKALIDLSPASAIHEIRFTAQTTDAWLIGSFNLDSSLEDFAFTGFDVVPEPTSMAALLGLLTMRGRGARQHD